MIECHKRHIKLAQLSVNLFYYCIKVNVKMGLSCEEKRHWGNAPLFYCKDYAGSSWHVGFKCATIFTWT